MSVADTIGLGKLGHAIEAAEDKASSALTDLGHGARRAASDAWHGVVETAHSAARTMEQTASDVERGATRAVHDAKDGVRQGHALEGLGRAEHDIAGGLGQGLSDTWDGAARTAGTASRGAVAVVRDAGVAAGQAFDHATDAGAHVVAAVAGHKAGDAAREMVHAIAEPVREASNFGFGAAQEVVGGAGSLVHDLGAMIVGGVRVGTEAQYRDKLIHQAKQLGGAVENVVEAAVNDPAGTAQRLGRAAEGYAAHVVQDGKAAAKNGTFAEWAGHVAGRAAFEVGSTVLTPEAKGVQISGLATRAARALDRVIGGAEKASEAARVSERFAKPAVQSAEHFAEAGGRSNDAMRSAGTAVRRSGRMVVPGAGTAADAAQLGKYTWIQDVNGGQGLLASKKNCLLCVYNVDRGLATGQVTGAPDLMTKLRRGRIGEFFGTKLVEMDRQAFEADMLAKGEGTRAIVEGHTPDRNFAHMWNAVVDNNRVVYLDGQIGAEGTANFAKFPETRMGITGKVGDGVFGPAPPRVGPPRRPRPPSPAKPNSIWSKKTSP